MRKEFGITGRFGSARKVLRAFRLISNKEDFPRSPSVSAIQDLKRLKNFNVQAHIVGIQCMNEIELQKAMVLVESRHDK